MAIDDFGTGYSSLARERDLKVDSLKIDKYFIDKLMIISNEESITGDIINMAHKLGQIVVAEGVEHDKQMQYLIDNDCDLIQGYLISKPLEMEAAIELLNKLNKE
jgi:EAL domain-containing protein (putative c-di-GMP-specific phosphodiesterase class I)